MNALFTAHDAVVLTGDLDFANSTRHCNLTDVI